MASWDLRINGRDYKKIPGALCVEVCLVRCDDQAGAKDTLTYSTRTHPPYPGLGRQ